jgi:hypothetical protein
MARTITAAGSTFTLLPLVASLFPVPLVISGFSADAAFESQPVKPVEAKKGVDGLMALGYIPYIVPLRFTLMANSTSIDDLDAIRIAQDTLLDVILCNAEIVIPSAGKRYEFSNGGFTELLAIPPARRMLEAVAYEMTFDKCLVFPA